MDLAFRERISQKYTMIHKNILKNEPCSPSIVMLVICTLLLSGCLHVGSGLHYGEENKSEARIVMAQGSLSVKNDSNVDLFPVVHAKMEEDFGVVTAGDFKMVGFAAIDVNKAARVTWIDGKWDNAREEEAVTFPLNISGEMAGQTRHLEFCYKVDGVWVLNLYSAQHPDPAKLLVSIPGETVE